MGISLAVWKIHRRIGMSGGLFINALARELGTELDPETAAALPKLHDGCVPPLDTTACGRCLEPSSCSRR